MVKPKFYYNIEYFNKSLFQCRRSPPLINLALILPLTRIFAANQLRTQSHQVVPVHRSENQKSNTLLSQKNRVNVVHLLVLNV